MEDADAVSGPKAWTAEFLGSFTFITVGVGSVIVANTGLAPIGVLGVAAAHGLTFAVLVSAFSGISGGHINPVVTFSALIGGRIRPADAFAYMLAQFAGAYVAVAVIWAMFGRFAHETQFVTPAVRAGFPLGRAILIEAVFTFFVVLAMWATVIEERGSRIGGFGPGLMLFVGILVAAQATGAALNPARHIAPAVFAGNLTNWWVYWVGPAAGGLLAGLIYPLLLGDRSFGWRLVPARSADGPPAPGQTRRGRPKT